MAYLIAQLFANGGNPGEAASKSHSDYLREHVSSLIAFGPLAQGGKAAGYVYFTNHDSQTEAEDFSKADPLARHSRLVLNRWRSRLGREQADIPPRPAFRGYVMWGFGNKDSVVRREGLLPAHSAYFKDHFDGPHFVARGPLMTDDEKVWRGTSVAIEVEDRAAFERYLHNEPFYANGLYETVETYEWTRGVL